MGRPIKSEAGNQYGDLVVLGPSPHTGKAARWVVRCTCGVEKTVAGIDLRAGGYTSCGCMAKRKLAEANGRKYKGGCGVVGSEAYFNSVLIRARVAAKKAGIAPPSLTGRQLARLFKDHGKTCDICGESCVTGRRLAVDHCHETGRFRGFLCFRCNAGLGDFKDDPALLESAKIYLSQT